MGRTKEENKAGAKVFGQAAHTLGVIGQAALKADEFTGKQMIAQNIIPSIVLKAFSCELFFKSLIVAQQDDIKNIHKLDQLFAHINDTDKSTIKSLVISQLSITNQHYNEINFDTDLGKAANAFVDWRYFYEEPRSINIEFLDVLFDVLWKYRQD